MRSILLGVIVFIIVPKLKNTTTNHTPILEKGISFGKSKSALDSTIVAIKASIIMLIIATILIFGGYLPGYFPPIDAEPHGMPTASPA